MTVYETDWVCPASAPPVRNAAMAVQDGRIVAVGPREAVAGERRVRYPGCAIIPGFVNAHAHLELSIFRGLLENLAFPDWIARLVRLKYGVLNRADLKVSAQLGAIEMLRAGVTTVGEVMDAGTGWEAMREFGLQGVAYQEVFGPSEEAASDALQDLKRKVDGYRREETATQRVGVSPHAPYTVSRKLYQGTRDFCMHQRLPMTAHIAESSAETLFVRDGAGPFAEAHRRRDIPVVARGRLPVAYLDELELLGPDMLLIHAIEVDDSDIRRIRETGTAVAHCPKSNAMLGHRIARVAELRRQRVRVALGTDSTASNDAIDMFGEMRTVIAQQEGITSDDVFRMATIEGARALNLDGALGSLEHGNRADFVVLELSVDADDPIASIVSRASRSDIRALFIGGVEVRPDDSAILREAERIQSRLRSAAAL